MKEQKKLNYNLKKTKKQNNKLILILLLTILLLISFILLSNYLNKPKTENIKILKYETKSLCNHAFNQSCKNLFENIKNVEKINENEIIIYSLTNCCAKFEILSIIKKNNLIQINLIEKGKQICYCGANLQKTNIKINKPINLNKTKIFQFKEYTNQNIQIYP